MSVNVGDLSRYLIIAGIGVGVLVLRERGELARVYDVGGLTIQTATFGWGAIGFASVICVLAYLFWIRNML